MRTGLNWFHVLLEKQGDTFSIHKIPIFQEVEGVESNFESKYLV